MESREWLLHNIWLMQNKLPTASHNLGLWKVCKTLEESFSAYSGYSYSTTKISKCVNLCDVPGFDACAFSVGWARMHATQSQESVQHMCYRTLTTMSSGQRPEFAFSGGDKWVQMSVTHSERTLKGKSVSTARSWKGKHSLCAYYVFSLFCHFQKEMNGRVSGVNIQIMWKHLM